MKERDGKGSKRGLRIKHDYSGAGGEGRVKDAGKTMSEGVGPLLTGRSWDPELGDRARNVGSQTRVCVCVCVCVCVYMNIHVYIQGMLAAVGEGGSAFWRASIFSEKQD